MPARDFAQTIADLLNPEQKKKRQALANANKSRRLSYLKRKYGSRDRYD
jgi:hypothetical protein